LTSLRASRSTGEFNIQLETAAGRIGNKNITIQTCKDNQNVTPNEARMSLAGNAPRQIEIDPECDRARSVDAMPIRLQTSWPSIL